MKRIGHFFAIVMLVCVALCNCAWTPQPVPKSLGGISAGSTFNLTKIKLIHGAPTIQHFPNYPFSRDLYTFEQSGLRIGVDKDNRISWASISRPSSILATEHGIKVGSSLAEVIDTYGIPNNNHPMILRYYYDTSDKKYGCIFWIAQDNHEVLYMRVGLIDGTSLVKKH